MSCTISEERRLRRAGVQPGQSGGREVDLELKEATVRDLRPSRHANHTPRLARAFDRRPRGPGLMSQDDPAPTPIGPEQAVARFADAWTSGTRPQVDDFAALVAPADQDAFYELVEDYIVLAPSPVLTDQAREQLHRDPSFIRVMDATIHLENLLNDLDPPT